MCLSVNYSNNLSITYDYKVFSKPHLNLLTNKKLYWKSNLYRRNKNTALMFVRAPKHFKSGKQHIFFFNTLIRKKYTYRVLNTTLLGQYKNILALYSFAKLLDVMNIKSSVYVSRVTFEQNLILSFNY